VDCEAVADLMVTTPTTTVDDWSGFWLCFQEEAGCEGERCSWNYEDLPTSVKEEDCAVASTESCTIDGEEVAWCREVDNTGFVDVDCTDADALSITAHGLPDHTFENYALSETLPPILEAEQQDKTVTLPTDPEYKTDDEIVVFTGALGDTAVAANGVSIFNQFTGIATVAVTDETVDDCGGHPANGQYHYHSIPYCGALVDRLGDSAEHSGLMGMAADGFPVFGPYGFADAGDATGAVTRMESCYALTEGCDNTDADCYAFDQDAFDAGDCHLDPCNGRITAVPPEMQAAFGTEIYAYYMTLDNAGDPAFPYLPYCFRGEAETSSGGGSGGGGGMGGGGMP
jgi:hypothetical protein